MTTRAHLTAVVMAIWEWHADALQQHGIDQISIADDLLTAKFAIRSCRSRAAYRAMQQDCLLFPRGRGSGPRRLPAQLPYSAAPACLPDSPVRLRAASTSRLNSPCDYIHPLQ